MAYATPAQLVQLGINADALSDVLLTTQQAALDACSARVDDALASGGTYTPPLASWPMSITLCVCKLAQYELIGAEGYSPDTGTEKVLLERYKQAEAMLAALAKGGSLFGAVDATPSVNDEGDVAMTSDTARGW
jgi:phage gp36-like protein